MKNHFYHHNIWKHVAAFADLFNDMEVYVYDKQRKNVLGKKKVPVILGPKEKVISVLSVIDGTPKPEIDNHLPKISIIWNGLNWDQARQTGSNHKRDLGIELRDNDGELSSKLTDRQTIPYLMEFQVTLWTVYLDEAVQLLENILPFFHPDLHLSLYERGSGIERKTKVELQSVAPNFVYELNEPDRRMIQFDLSFIMEVNLYRPIEIDGVIERAYIGISAVNENSPEQNEGDVIYVTTQGISGEITDENIRTAIVGFDEIDTYYTNPNLEEIINQIEVQKYDAIESLPPGTDDTVVRMLADDYDDVIRRVTYTEEHQPFNALQYRRNLKDTMEYTRAVFMENTGLVDPAFPMYFEEGYQEMYDELNEQQQVHLNEVAVSFESRIYALIKANEANEFVQSLVESGDNLFTPGIGERAARYNYLFDTLE